MQNQQIRYFSMLTMLVAYWVPNALASEAKRVEISVAPVVEYINLEQIDAEDPFAPRDKGPLFGLLIGGTYTPKASSAFKINVNLKYSWSRDVEYTGSAVFFDEATNRETVVPISGLRSDYELLDFDVSAGYEFELSADTKIQPFLGYKLWRWDNVLSPNQNTVHEVSTTHGILAGSKLSKKWSDSHSSYVNAAVIVPTHTEIDILEPSFPSESLGNRVGYNLKIGHNIDQFFIEGRYSRYNSGSGFVSRPIPGIFAPGDLIKTPVEIDLFSLAAGVRF